LEHLISWWQHLPSRMIRTFSRSDRFQIRYYSLMYIVALPLTYFLVVYRLQKEKFPYTRETIQDHALAIIGVILGGRLVMSSLYFEYYLRHPRRFSSL